ncbi:tRNA preQ1(34) S-adenosylmethionine ribosyltransferase-isomerase QueA [Ruminococcaceae bacterium OttesenSCG-928-O06]|nr:tRNA preQ1(34) S-adenosylmethionine ribosyltransferase-isomerase QueA [Ruminococcaceae bacterium OttesenSCG-928-O06]
MRKSDFDFALPPELIAQTPASPRDSSRLLCMDKATGSLQHRTFWDLPALLRKGDLLVLNDSRVIAARLIGEKQGSGGVCELLLLRQVKGDVWECLAKPGKRLRPGAALRFGDGTLTAEVLETLPNGGKHVRFCYDTQTLYEKLDAFGEMPLPPYIKTKLANKGDYQTVYAKHPGSAAAPTAGLHFTPDLMEKLQHAGIGFAHLTLHVGLGTFRPVQEERIEDHTMHSEWYSLEEDAAQAINHTQKAGGRVICVGTTSCRTLETVARNNNGNIVPGSGETDIFLYPGSMFLATDGLLTNFHLPESTLIMLVSAFCGRENTLNAYRVAVEERYRFFSFGDAMLIL